MRIISNRNIVNSYKKEEVKDNSNNISLSHKNDNPDYYVNISITGRMKSNHYSLVQALSNNVKSTRMLNSTNAILNQYRNILMRIEHLVNKKKQTLSGEDKELIEVEISTLVDEIDRISSQSNYNRVKLFDGSLSRTSRSASLWFQFGYNKSESARLYLATISSQSLHLSQTSISKKDIGKAQALIEKQQQHISQLQDQIKKHSKKLLKEFDTLSHPKNANPYDGDTEKIIERVKEEMQ